MRPGRPSTWPSSARDGGLTSRARASCSPPYRRARSRGRRVGAQPLGTMMEPARGRAAPANDEIPPA
eukprot:11202733-Lingulodinium_polyedra.AAC.1